jgi:hypothetical protein
MTRSVRVVAWLFAGLAGAAACSSETSLLGDQGPLPECPLLSCAPGELALCSKPQKQSAPGYCYKPCGKCETSHYHAPCFNDEVGCGCKTEDAACPGTCVNLNGVMPIGVYGSCAAECNPLTSQCPAGQTCLYASEKGYECWVRTDFNTGNVLLTWLADGDDCDDPNAKAGLDSRACGPGLQCVPTAEGSSTMHCRRVCDVSAETPCAKGTCMSLVAALPNAFAKSPSNVGVCCETPISSGCM